MNNVLWLQVFLGIMSIGFGGFYVAFSYWQMMSKDKTINKLFMLSGLISLVVGAFLIFWTFALNDLLPKW